VVYETSLEKFGAVESKNGRLGVVKRPNRRQVRKGQLRTNQRALKRQLKEAPEHEKARLRTLLDDIKKQILVLSRAENQRKRRKRKRKARDAFYKNPYAFAKSLFTESKSGVLDVPQEELEEHLKKTYSDSCRDVPLPHMHGITKPAPPGLAFDMSNLKAKEVREFVRKARTKSAPGMNGLSYKLYKNCPLVLGELTVLLQRAWKEDLIPQDWCLADGIQIPKEKNSVGIGNFRPISLLNVEGKIFFGVIARRMTNFLMDNGLIDTSVQKAGIPGFPGCLEHAQMIWNSIRTAKQDKSEQHVVWLDLANAYG